MDLLIHIIFFVSLQGFFLGLAIVYKKKFNNDRPNLFFAIIIGLFSVYLLEFYLSLSGLLPSGFTYISYPTLFFIAPLIFLYQRLILAMKVTGKLVFQTLIPGILIYLAFIPFYILHNAHDSTCPLTTIATFDLTYIAWLRKPWVFFLFSLS